MRIRKVALCAAVVLGTPFAAPYLGAQEKAAKPLYERLGGVYAIATVVDDFVERLLVNEILNANPAINEARTRVPKAGLKFHVTTLVCEVTGGSCKYGGRTMKAAHVHLNINDKEWNAMLADFTATLNRFGVPAAEQQELVGIVASTKPDIVMAPAPAR